MYRFQDHGGRWVGLRFDLTVPLARFVAQHAAELGMPFKRYHIATVWRGENTQRGRYREFMQCDFDTIGTLSTVSDTETALVIHDLLRAIGFERFVIRINNRLVLSGLLEKLGVASHSVAILRALDKLGKIGRQRVEEEMVAQAGVTQDVARQVLQLTDAAETESQALLNLERLVRGNAQGEAGVGRLREVLQGARQGGVPPERICIDPAIARGLDYYTGTIYETYLADLPGIGSVCSGGRYDNLAGQYTTQELPGVGASLGLDRLLAAMEELGLIEKVHTSAEVFLAFFDADRLHGYLQLAAALRSAGLNVELYPEARRIGQQLKYADRRGFQLAIIIGPDEWMAQTAQLKNLRTGQSETISLAGGPRELTEGVRRQLASRA
jgi:histidyl-tRNA synthetase